MSVRKIFSVIFYSIALISSAGGTALIVYAHIDTWMRGHFVLSTVASPLIVEHAIFNCVFWIIARLLQKMPKLDRVFYILTAIPFAMMLMIPGRFGLGDL